MDKIYKSVEKLKEDLAMFDNDFAKIAFLQIVKNDKETFFYKTNKWYDPNLSPKDVAELINSVAQDAVILYCEDKIEFYKQKAEIEKSLPLKKSKKRPTHATLMTLVEKLGIVKNLNVLGVVEKIHQARIIGTLIGMDEQNTREFITYGYEREDPMPNHADGFYNTPENNKFVANLLKIAQI